MKLDDVRREYLKDGLRKSALALEPVAQLESWLQQANQVALVDATAMTLATVDEKGQPSQRVVLLKQLDSEGLVFYTNLNSSKAQDIKANNKVSAHFAWLPLERQVKIQGTAIQLSSTESLKYFISRPKDSQLAAWASPQSQVIDSRQFLKMSFDKMKQKFADGKIPLPDFWGGYRIKPHTFEFWQGGGARLHDRFVYRLRNDQWIIERLAP